MRGRAQRIVQQLSEEVTRGRTRVPLGDGSLGSDRGRNTNIDPGTHRQGDSVGMGIRSETEKSKDVANEHDV